PCVSGGCTDPACCSAGYKYEWPEVVGKSPQVAKQIIEKDNPYVAVMIQPGDGVKPPDFCCNRVVVFLDCYGIVRDVPIVG
ncbi:potato_inhibit domain-containing protein, partial [Cephalotus follicularis]